MGEILVVVAEKQAGEPVVVEGERDLGGLLDDARGRWSGRALPRCPRAVALSDGLKSRAPFTPPPSARRHPPPRRTGCSTPPGRSGPARYRRSAGGRPRSAPPGDRATCRRAGRHGGPASPGERRRSRPTVPRLKAWRCVSSSACRRARRSALTASGTWSASSARRRARARAVLEREGARETDVRDEPQRVREIGLGLAREADDEVGRERDVGARRAHAIDRGGGIRRLCACGSWPRGCGRSPACTGRCR